MPTTADWKHISDLQVWDYFHLEDEKGCTEEELQPEILYAIAEDLELELQNSLSLRLHPSLRRAQIRRLEAAEYHSMNEKSKAKRARQRNLRKLLRKHKKNLCKKLAQKVQGMSREEALAELQDEVRQEKGKAKNKPSLAFKASTKNKASLKTKPSAKLKSKKKHSEKTALVKASAKAGSKQHLSEDPPLPPPEQAPPAENESEDPLPMQEAIVVSEAAGKLSFGKQGRTTHGSTSGMYTCVTDFGGWSSRALRLHF